MNSLSYLLHYLKSSGKVPGWVRRVQCLLVPRTKTNILWLPLTKLYSKTFWQIARAYYSSDIFNEKELCTVVEQHANVIMDSGRIVRSWGEVVSEKYSNLPGIWDLHDFLALRFSAIMKVRETCYTGTLVNTPMRINDTSCIALPTVSHSYYALKSVKELSEKDLHQMYTNFIHREKRHEYYYWINESTI